MSKLKYTFGITPNSWSGTYCFSKDINEINYNIRILENKEIYFIELAEYNIEVKVDKNHKFGQILKDLFTYVNKENFSSLSFKIIHLLIVQNFSYQITEDIMRHCFNTVQRNAEERTTKKLQRKLKILLGI